MNTAPCTTTMNTGMARSLLTEIQRMLGQLADNGQEDAIDLRSLPLTDADLLELEDLLGQGEVYVELDVSGQSRIWETAYTGAWWVRHYGAGDRISSEQIAICSVPDILFADPADIAASATRLARTVEKLDD